MYMDDFFARVYAVLVDTCAASSSPRMRNAFVCEFTSDNPTSQFRFGGALGFDGKFRFPQFSLTCYSDDLTTESKEMMRRGNEALALLRMEYVAALHDAAEAV